MARGPHALHAPRVLLRLPGALRSPASSEPRAAACAASRRPIAGRRTLSEPDPNARARLSSSELSPPLRDPISLLSARRNQPPWIVLPASSSPGLAGSGSSTSGSARSPPDPRVPGLLRASSSRQAAAGAVDRATGPCERSLVRACCWGRQPMVCYVAYPLDLFEEGA
ncbi:hypothetical protein ZWY2020_058271 [Hordeum vulgare]|nr:hypothetical protein ZWY2020_058271 [Hordeum vulgare]